MPAQILEHPALKDRNGSDGGNMEERIARLEAHVEHIDTTLTDIKQDIRETRSNMNDFRRDLSSNLKWSIGTSVTMFGILTALIAKGFHWF